jgi:predicted amidohydrolase
MRCEKAAIDENINEMRRYLDQAKDAKVDIVCFPEMNITGYIDPQQHPEAVIFKDHQAINRVAELSREYDTVIAAGFVEKNPEGKPYITQFISENGSIKGYYRKKTIKEDEAKWFSPGKDQPIFIYKGIRYGLAICADIDEENIFSELAGKGARLVLECAAPGLYGDQSSRDWLDGFEWWRCECFGKLGKYAVQNGIFIAVSTQAGRTVDEDFPGGGYMFSSDGECLAQASDWKEGILTLKLTFET